MEKSFCLVFAASSESQYLETTIFPALWHFYATLKIIQTPNIYIWSPPHLDHARLANGPIANDHDLHGQLNVLVPEVGDVHRTHLDSTTSWELEWLQFRSGLFSSRHAFTLCCYGKYFTRLAKNLGKILEVNLI